MGPKKRKREISTSSSSIHSSSSTLHKTSSSLVNDDSSTTTEQENILSFNQCDCETYITILFRFLKFCHDSKITDECINWTGCKSVNGYGIFRLFKRNYQAHQVAYMLWNFQEIPQGFLIRHLCKKKNRLCVNPLHLALGTALENAQDETTGGFRAYGEDVHNAQLTNATARQIFNKVRYDKMRITDCADLFGVKIGVVQSISAGKTWSHILTEYEKKNLTKTRKIIPKFTNDEVREIRSLKDELSCEEIAYHCDTSKHIIKNIMDRKTYANVPSDSDDDEKIKQANIQQHCQQFIKKFELLVTKDKGDDGQMHWFYKNDRSKQTRLKTGKYHELSFFGKMVSVHRLSFMVYNNRLDLISTDHVCHKCKYKHCVNPEHLNLGDAVSNAADKIRDGTICRGEKCSLSKITEDMAMHVIDSQGTGSLSERSKILGISKGIIQAIDSKISWKHLPRPSNDN